MLEYHVLGQLRVVLGGDELHVGGPRLRRLLAMLLVHRDEVVSTDRLVEAVFTGNPTPAAATTLRSYVARLRKVVDDGDGDDPVLQTVAPGYRLRVADEALDAVHFERLVAEGRACRRRHDPVGAASSWRSALGMWAGDAYAEFDGEHWVAAEAQRLAELRSVTEEALIDAELDCGLAAELVGRIEVLVDREPLRGSFRGKLMVALYRSGRQADALAVMREYRQVLAQEAGLDPSPELEELANRILAHDEDLRQVRPPARLVRGYRLGERLGSGRDGTVHAARLSGVDRDLVIRSVPPTTADRPDVVRSFDSTMRRVAALHHDAIVPIQDHWREPGGAWVVLRRMRGGTLRDRLTPGPLGLTEVSDLAARIGSALHAAAQVGIVHGRVIPESILYDETGRAHLSDFPLGEVDSDHEDDVRAFARCVHEALTGPSSHATTRAPTATQQEVPPGAEILRRTFADPSPASITRLLADFEREASPSTRAPLPRSNPYKGLQAFDEADAADFFGREHLIAEMVDRLSRRRSAGDRPSADLGDRLILVVGASGSGKSSVVRAGLLPRVRTGVIPGSERWFITSMIPGATPFKELAEGLARVATTSGAHASAVGGGDRKRELVNELAADDHGIATVMRRVVPEGGQLLLVVDQLEELFTLAGEDVQRCFLDGLMHALSDPDGQLRVVATLRGDFYDRPLGFQRFGAAVRDATVAVPVMTASELEAAIRGPADRVGLQVESPLVAELVTAVVDQPAAMPSLQFTLYELAQTATNAGLQLAAYRDLGGVGRAIASRAEALYRSIDDDHDLVRHMFEQLIVIGPEGHPTRRPAVRSELSTASGGRTVQEMIDPWVQARLLSTDRHPETREPTVEVAHEALLREWPRLRGWIDADRAAIVAAGQLREAAASWQALDRDTGALYRGTKLDAVLEQLGGRADTLPADSREFLDASTSARGQRREHEAERVAEQGRTNRRLRRQLAALAAAMTIAVIGGVVALDQRGRAQQQAMIADEQAQVAEDERRLAFTRELAAASTAVVDEDPELGILLALEAVDQTGGADEVLPEAESALHRAVTTSRIALRVPGIGGSVDWSPTGTVFVTEGPEDSGLVDLRDAATGESVRSWSGHDRDINDVAFSPDGSLLATTGDDGLLRIWDPDTGDMQAEVAGAGAVWGVSFSPDGSRVAAAWVEEGLVRIQELASDEGPLEVRADTGALADSTSFSPDGSRLAIGDSPDVVVVDVVTGEELLAFPVGGVPFSVAWSPDGRWIASGAEPATRVTDAVSGQRYLDLDGHSGVVFELDWNEDGTMLATGARDGTARVWEVTEGGATPVAAVAAREGAVGGLAFSPDGNQLLTGDLGVTATRIWDVGIAGGAEWVNLPTSTRERPDATFTPDGKEVVVTGDGVAAVLWDLRTATPSRTLGEDLADAWRIAVSPDGALVATIGFDNPPQVHVWDIDSATQVWNVAERDFWPENVAWAPDGAFLAVPGHGPQNEPGRTKVLDRDGQQVADLLEDATNYPRDVAFSPDGQQLAILRVAAGQNNPNIEGVQVWDWSRGEVLTSLPVHADEVAFDPTGPRIATADVGTGGGSIWDADTGTRVATLSGHNGDITDLDFSPNGAMLATAGADGTVRLWSVESGTEQLVLRGHDDQVWSVAFGPDGDRLLSTGYGVARVWALDLDDLIDIARSRITRALTEDECRQYLHVDGCPG